MRFAEVFDNVINDFKVNNAFAPQTALQGQLACRFSALLCLTVDSIRRRTRSAPGALCSAAESA